MPAELMLNFLDPTQVAVHLLDEYADMTSVFAFVNPLTDNNMEEIRWYPEEYGTGYQAEPDDERADRVREQLPGWRTALCPACHTELVSRTDFFVRTNLLEEGRSPKCQEGIEDIFQGMSGAVS